MPVNFKHHKWRHMGNGGIAPPIFNLDIRRRKIISFTLHSLCSHRRNPRYPLYRRLVRPRLRGGEEKISSPDGTEHWSLLYWALRILVSARILPHTLHMNSNKCYNLLVHQAFNSLYKISNGVYMIKFYVFDMNILWRLLLLKSF